MMIIGYIICLFYFWFGYKILGSKTYGCFLHQFITIISFIFLYIASIFYIFKGEYIYLWTPVIPYIVYAYNQDRLRKKMKTIIYKKN